MSENAIVRHFAAAARTYDDAARVQRRVADDLLRRCPAQASDILELGCGTGIFTEMLALRYPRARIMAVDFSPEMLSAANAKALGERVHFVASDIVGPVEGQFDLVASNAAFQWVDDLDGLFAGVRTRLVDGGDLAFSYFGPDTYRELRSALAAVLGYKVTLPSSAFAPVDRLRSAMERYFVDVRIETGEYVEEFASLRDLLANVKSTGTRGRGIQPPVKWTRGLLERVEERYLAEFGSIRVTYEVGLCGAKSMEHMTGARPSFKQFLAAGPDFSDLDLNRAADPMREL